MRFADQVSGPGVSKLIAFEGARIRPLELMPEA